MIVDDDELIIERLKTIIPFKKLRLELCCEARDGEEALELFEQFKPQIVISDINIPLLNGLDFANRVLEESDETGIIIITGFGSLDYAQKALKSGISDFLLKPINNEEIEGSLRRIISQLKKRADSLGEKQNIQTLLNESLPLLQKRYLSSLLNNVFKDDEDVARSHIERLGIKLDGDYFCVAVLIPNYYEHEEKDREVIQLTIEETISEIMSEADIKYILFYDALSRLIVIASGAENIDLMLEKQLSTAKDKLRFYFRYNFIAGIGWCKKALTDLSESLKSADNALNYNNSFGENNMVNIKNVLYNATPKAQAINNEGEKVVESLKNCDEAGLDAALHHYFVSLMNISQGAEAFAKQSYIELAVDIIRCMRENGLGIDIILEDDPYTKIMLSPNLQRTHKYIAELCFVLIEQMKEKYNNRNSRLIEQAKRYISENLEDNELNLINVSDTIGLSKAYFCSLFKRETGYSFTEYINYQRIEKAKILLSTTNLRVYEVAQAVGYLSPKYFFQVFKRITNKRPKDYYNDTMPRG
jgi:two-component system response regulator YesN